MIIPSIERERDELLAERDRLSTALADRDATIANYRDVVEKHQELRISLSARIVELEGALRPFANAASSEWCTSFKSGDQIVESAIVTPFEFSTADLRRAKAALSSPHPRGSDTRRMIDRYRSSHPTGEGQEVRADARGWQPIETAPKGEYVDLWIVGADDWVDFYAPNACKVKDKPLRHGRATHWRLCPDGKWHSSVGLGYPLSPDVTPTHWQPLPAPPLPATPATGLPTDRQGEGK